MYLRKKWRIGFKLGCKIVEAQYAEPFGPQGVHLFNRPCLDKETVAIFSGVESVNEEPYPKEEMDAYIEFQKQLIESEKTKENK